MTGNDDDEQDDRERRADADALLALTEGLGVELVGHHRGPEVTAGHRSDDVEGLQRTHGDGGDHHDDGRPNGRHRHLPEQLEPGGTVDLRGLDDVVGHRLDRRGQHGHGEPGLDPDHHDDQEEGVPRFGQQELVGLQAEPDQDLVGQADLIRARLAVVVDELPDDRGADHGDCHRQEDQRLRQPSRTGSGRPGPRRSGRKRWRPPAPE